MESNQDFQRRLCAYCFDNLLKFLNEEKLQDYEPELDNHEYPLFVTWQKQGHLRGCIGTFRSDKLGRNLS